MNLMDDLLAWDGKSFDGIDGVHGRFSQTPDYIPQLLELMQQPDLQKGTTWLLKRYVEAGGVLDEGEITAVYTHLLSFENWEAKLHILQIMHAMPIPASHEAQLYNFLKTNAASDKKFVRAWSYNGLFLLAQQYGGYKTAVQALLQTALQDEAPSVIARLRKIVK